MLIAAWSDFLGANLRLTPKRLPDGVGVNALNLRLGSADLRGWGAASTVVTTGGATPLISAYRMNRATVSDTAEWIQWTMDVDVVRSLIANDTTEEIYFTGDGAPKRTNNVLGLPSTPAPAATRSLGIPKPTAAMTLAVGTAGGGSNETRVYVDTFVNDLGRESAPGTSATIVIAGGSGAVVDITNLDPAPGGYPDLTLRRIYCSTDGGEFLLVTEQAIATSTATDNGGRSYVLESGGSADKPAWEVPPTYLKGLIGLWNGMIGGFYGKSYAVCEPWKPWAWPVEYQDTVPDDIVGTGKWLQNWLILTTAQPYLVTGSSPMGLGNQPIAFDHACVSKRSIVSMGHGVVWASANGLCYMGSNGPAWLTEKIISPEQWAALVPSTIIGNRYERYYVGFYNDGTAKGFILDPLDPAGLVFLDFGARGTFYDPISDRLYLQDTGNTIKRFNAGSALSATFKTGIKRHPYETNAGFARVVADSPISVQVTLWANVLQTNGTYSWTQVFQRTVTAGEPFALPAGYLAQDFQAQLVTTGPVQGLVLAEGIEDLV